MVDYHDSSQLHSWLFESDYELDACRARANYEGRKFLYDISVLKKKNNNNKNNNNSTSTNNNNNNDGTTTSSSSGKDGTEQQQQVSDVQTTSIVSIPSVPPISHFACDPIEREKTVKQQQQKQQSPTSKLKQEEGEGEGEEQNSIQVTVESSSSIDGGGWYNTNGPLEDCTGKSFVTMEQECVLVNFYVSKLGSIIGPNASVQRLRRESKVLATAAVLLKRFYLSNSIMLFDPKTIMVASAFLACKVEDVTADIRNIEEATVIMNSPLTIQQIVQAEVYLLSGIHFYLLCFHPYKALLALTEDLRTFLKTSNGRKIVSLSSSVLDSATGPGTEMKSTTTTATATAAPPTITGQDLKPIYDTARLLLDDVIISDLPLLYTPGQIGLASLIASQSIVLELFYKDYNNKDGKSSSSSSSSVQQHLPPKIDILAYVKERFPNGHDNTSSTTNQDNNKRNRGTATDTTTPPPITTSSSSSSSNDYDDPFTWLPECLDVLTNRIRQLKNGLYGCGYYITDLSQLKKIHKKLKKIRFWSTNNNNNDTGDDDDNPTDDATASSTSKKKKKKDKKHKVDTVTSSSMDDSAAGLDNVTSTNLLVEPSTKRVKFE